jgi:general secretion pathway protein D
MVKERAQRVTPNVETVRIAEAVQRAEAESAKTAAAAADNSRVHKGTGVMVKPSTAQLSPAPPSASQPSEEVSLNYEGADLREVIRTIFDILGEGYIIDPQVTGTVNIHTARGIPKSALISTLETLCRMNGMAVVKDGDVYRVIPAATAVRGSVTPQLGGSSTPLPKGYGVVLVPLRYIGVAEMVRVLEPFVKDATSIRPDPLRNLIVLSGTESEVRRLMETIEMFDIDWMAGMSVGLFTLKSADVKTVFGEIEKIIGDKAAGPLAGILRIIPIERMNALLVISPQPHYIDQARIWIDRLDKGGDDTGTQLFVYHVQNGRAEKLAPLLSQAFTGRAPAQTSGPTRQAQIAPGLTPGSIFSQPVQTQQTPPPTPQAASAPTTPGGAAPGAAGGLSTNVSRNVQIIADKDNNALLVMSTPAEYSIIEQALRKLDLLPKQVLIEATIAEVQLTGDLKFGVEWYFSNGPKQGGGLFQTGTQPGNPFNPGSTGGLSAPKVPGFNYLWRNDNFPGGIGAALTMLDNAGKTRVLSNPHIMAVDNITSKIQVGTRVPINQQTIVGGTTNAVTTTQQYLDTGIALTVTPHVNEGGLVAMDLAVEYSTLPAGFDPTAASGIAPSVNSRSQQTSVVANSGETIVFGGLITEDNSKSTQGIPLLSRIPVIGAAFGAQEFKTDRTELLLVITPRVMSNDAQVREITRELRNKMLNLDESVLPAPIKKKEPVPPAATVPPH